MHSKNEDTHHHIHSLEENEARGSPDHETSSVDDYPDGGWRAWSVVLGAWCALIPTFGIVNTSGVFEEWISNHQLQGHPKSTAAWIFSLYIFFLYVAGVQVGMLVFSFFIFNFFFFFLLFSCVLRLGWCMLIWICCVLKRSYIRRLWDEIPAYSRLYWARGIPDVHERLNWSVCLPLSLFS